MAAQDAGEELLEYARYGESVDLDVLLTTGGVDVNYADEGGNTALHKAAANGHLDCVEVLIRYHAKYTSNLSGNTPLHWAAMNGNLPVVKLILKSYQEVDVLSKNGFGQGALSEAFRSGNSELIALLLEHPTSSEEKLMSKVELGAYIGRRVSLTGLSKIEMNGREGVCIGVEEARLLIKLAPPPDTPDAKAKTVKVKHKNVEWLKDPLEQEDKVAAGTGENEMAQIEHEFMLAEGSEEGILRIRECAMDRADSPFQTEEEYDSTGLSIWCASVIMARWVADHSMQGAAHYLEGKRVIELGAGVGVSGLSGCLYAKPSLMVLTDLHEGTIANLKHNASLLPDTCNVRVESLSWGCDTSDQCFDVVMGSDLVYCEAIAPLLASTVAELLAPNGYFLYACPASNGNGRAGLDRFLTVELQKQFGFKLISSIASPSQYAENPLASKDATACFLHFSELGLPYALHVFQKCDLELDTVDLLPNGHTSYSWGDVADVASLAKPPPKGHTTYSWGSVQMPC